MTSLAPDKQAQSMASGFVIPPRRPNPEESEPEAVERTRDGDLVFRCMATIDHDSEPD